MMTVPAGNSSYERVARARGIFSLARHSNLSCSSPEEGGLREALQIYHNENQVGLPKRGP